VIDFAVLKPFPAFAHRSYPVVKPSPSRAEESHRGIWQQIVESGQAQSMLVSPDCRPHPRLEQLLAAHGKDIPNDWDVLVLGGYYASPPRHVCGHVFSPQKPTHIHGYIIRADACRRLVESGWIDHIEDIWSSRDRPTRMNVYAIWPNLIFPTAGDRFTSFNELGVYGSSRFGNQLFQVTATLTTAARHGYRARLPMWPYAKSFAGHFDQTAEPPTPLAKYVERQFHYTEIPSYPNTDIVGFFQSHRYFTGYEKLIRDYFRPSADVATEVHRQRAKLFNRPTVAVHIRRGDYLSMPERFRVLPIEYYRRAMSLFGSDVQFAIFGDDPGWAAQTFRSDNFRIISGNSEVTDLHLMASCDHQIIANSSFSWWGAWLNANPHKRVIAPDPWFGPAFDHNTRDLLPAEWMKLRA
jgi:hypothetical protein